MHSIMQDVEEERGFLHEEIEEDNKKEINLLEKNFFSDFYRKNKFNLFKIILCYFFSSSFILANGILYFSLTSKLYSNNPDMINYYGILICLIYVILGVLYTLVQSFLM